ncbi:MAG: RNA methyltransferase [Planctomycetes bacterium]|nr:RNA methyltransferase [Planctomycetota bacterium]
MPVPSREVFFATCAPGIEPVLHEEIRALRLGHVERQVGGVHFEGTIRDAWRANLWLRTAVRVLQRVARFEASDANALHAGASSVDWSRFVRADGTFVVDARSKESALDHTLFVEQRVKDGIADQFRAKSGRRPSVDKESPELGVHVHLFRDRCTLMVDTSGESLHKRGWRRFQGRAPLAETLAAAIVMMSGWDRRAPLLDPFCGSATILIEGALLAANVAPGLFRERFGFERWPGHDAGAWQAMRETARAESAFPPKLVVRGWDQNAEFVEKARENVAVAELADRIVLEVGGARDFEPRRGWNAWIVTNQPYGERVGDERDLELLYRRFGERLREFAVGSHLALLSGNPRLARSLGLKPDRVVALKNGALDCELLLAEIAG